MGLLSREYILEGVKEFAGEIDLEVVKEVAGELFSCWVLYFFSLVEDDMMEVER